MRILPGLPAALYGQNARKPLREAGDFSAFQSATRQHQRIHQTTTMLSTPNTRPMTLPPTIRTIMRKIMTIIMLKLKTMTKANTCRKARNTLTCIVTQRRSVAKVHQGILTTNSSHAALLKTRVFHRRMETGEVFAFQAKQLLHQSLRKYLRSMQGPSRVMMTIHVVRVHQAIHTGSGKPAAQQMRSVLTHQN